MTLELANRATCTPNGIVRDVFVRVGKFTFPANFVVVDYESDPRVLLILGRPLLRTARALIDVHGEEMILRDRDESTTFSSNSLLEEFTDELALITYPLDYDDNLKCDIEFDLRELEFLLYQREDSDLKDSIDQTDLANLDDLFVDPAPEMSTDEQPPDFSFPPIFDVYPDDFLEIEFDVDNFDDDLFDSKGEKIKESELLIDQLDLPCDIHSEYDSFASQDFSRDDDLPSPDNEDKDFDPPFYDLLVFKEVPNSMRILLFSSKNEEKVFKPWIYTSEKVYFCFLPELSHPGERISKKDKIESKPNKNGKQYGDGYCHDFSS
nr:reverse transcriptase domain-containing protein [Tanacetum cinerariifolium]